MRMRGNRGLGRTGVGRGRETGGTRWRRGGSCCATNLDNGGKGEREGKGKTSSASKAKSFGPETQPDWVRDLYQQAEDFPEEEYLKELLKDTGGDPAKIEANARRKLAQNVGEANKKTFEGEVVGAEGQGQHQHELAQMHVRFDEVDTFNLWIWFEFFSEPSEAEQEMLASVLDAWFVLGKLGSFNTVNLQISNSFEHSTSFFQYDESCLDTSLPAMFHEMEEPEFSGRNGRFWVNLGTCDEIALDLLINALHNFSNEYVSIRTLQIGGKSLASGTLDGWEAPARPTPFKQNADQVREINESIADDLSRIYNAEEGESNSQFQ
ncbi:DUF3531 domain-containing protein [Chloropicon primus]|uniref:DUF3531 domain-containing protein n=2 Tax=Chloropicon primus TaxID=1764295 RepID=A0A5B8MG90_9CHLO|nr:DUF3531 domain-containing protein [Chloropicon primus]UPQ98652.1 DUF3531 domain-containing protein [Chloropicon primus]|eukprot:QDZ19443.1 DUF3531 domain-containing protein [Chloropicon primus]